MVKKNIILIIGGNKNNNFFKNSIDIYLKRNDIYKIILVTWNTEDIEYVKDNSSIKIILMPPKVFESSIEGFGSIKYQKYLYDIGINYINDNYETNEIFILKTRMDVIFSNEQLNYIFSQDYKVETIKSELFKYKIWVAWAHITKPFYIDDAFFYSHISVMKNLSPYTGELFIQQGHQHIRWFLLLAREYNLYSEPNSYNDYFYMNSNFILNEITKNILIKYRACIKNYFIINTLKEGIIFRDWNNINFYKKPSNSILNIIENEANRNLKLVYNNEDFFNIDL
tara:strand:+ start:144 stop:992 length:849 start_codon:yes stop_codon:yes gene_type:complete